MINIKPSQRWRSREGETVVVLNIGIDEVEIYNFGSGLPMLTNCRMILVSDFRANFTLIPQGSNWRKPSEQRHGFSVVTWSILAACCVVCWLAIQGEPKNEDLIDCYLRETQQHVPTVPDVVLQHVVAKCQRGLRNDRVASTYLG